MGKRQYLSTLDCPHLALSGVDRLHPSQPEKLWRCDGCGYLVVPDGMSLLVGPFPYAFRRVWKEATRDAHP